MKIELTKSQIAYLKSLDSKKKKRKFLLDCFIENIEVGKKSKVKPIVFTNGVFQTNNKEAIDFLEKCWFIKNEKEESQELIEKSNEEPQLLDAVCVKINSSNRDILQKVYNEYFSNYFREKSDSVLNCEYLISNTPKTNFIQTDDLKVWVKGGEPKIVTTDEFLKYIGREDLIEKESEKISECAAYVFERDDKGNYVKIPKYSPNINQRQVSEQGSELLKFDMLEKSKKSFFLNKEQIEDSKEKEQKVYKYMFYSQVELTPEKINEIVEFITENNENAN